MTAYLERLCTALGILLYRVGLAGVVRRLRRGPRVLLYHAVQPEEDDFLRGLDSNTTPEVFERHLDYLARHHTVVPLETLEAGQCPTGAALITFDDGYRSVLTEALPRLQARGMSAVLYVVTDAVGSDRVVWVNELAWLLNRSEAARRSAALSLGRPPTSVTAELVSAAREGYEERATEALLDTVRAAAGHPSAAAAARREGWYITWEEARELDAAGVRIGNHTASHPVLGRMDAAAQRDEILRGREAVARELGSCSSLAYPFGSHDAQSAAVAADCGHRSVMLVGEHLRRDLLAIGRVPVRGTDHAALFAELEVVAPLKAAVRRLVRGNA